MTTNLGGDYTKDRSKVYYKGAHIAGCSAVTAKVWPWENQKYLRDSSKVYYKGKHIPRASPVTFKQAGVDKYFKDSSRVYYRRKGEHTVLDGASPVTFKKTAGPGDHYYQDSSKVWYRADGVHHRVQGISCVTIKVQPDGKSATDSSRKTWVKWTKQ